VKPETDDLNRERTHSEIMVVLIALMLAMLLGALDQTIVATALPRIATDLHGLSQLSWVATAYLLTSAISMPLYGKLGDMFGRKKILQTSIIIFLIGSALCGLSQNMDQLIFFRALQGIGAGGLFTLVLAVIGDIIPPRQRGRYQGYFGAVFGVASIAGPLLGGFFTGNLSWRWIFYINIPLGILALTAIASRLQLPIHHNPHKIDFWGAGLLGISAACLLLLTVWGGVTYPWASPQIIWLGIASFVAAVAFVIRERMAAEPILPLRLFKNDIFTVATIMSFFVGFVMFGAIIFIPEYQQIVRGYSPIKSGLLLLPLVGGLLVAVMGSGILITRWGRYRLFPIIGSLLVVLGIWLFSHISLTTNQLTLSIWMIVLGFGIGPFMQTTTLAAQNSVAREDLGTTTSTVTFARSIGSALGAAVFGAVLINVLIGNLHKLLPPHSGQPPITAADLQSGTASLHGIPPQVLHVVLTAFADAFQTVFLVGIPFALLLVVLAFLLRETPLRTSSHAANAGESSTLSHVG
jgi:EmrB/QacA subfamily drug resistance transporter